MRLTLSADADTDLDSITIYTVGQWGLTQARHYMNGLLDHLDLLADGLRRGRPIAVPGHDFLRSTYRSHFVYFVIAGDDLRVVRVLHQRMDQARHL